MPRKRNDENDEPSIRERLSEMMLKPPKANPTGPPAEVAPPRTLEELRHDNRYTTDKERMWGLFAAPIGAAIAFLVSEALLSGRSTKKILPTGKINLHYTNPGTYKTLLVVFLALALGMLVGAWFRKRMAIGGFAALFGLSLFNLGFDYWGFGIPYVLLGSWYLVRAYRTNRDLKAAEAAEAPVRLSDSSPRPSKRYTPPTSDRKRRRPVQSVGEGAESED